MNVSLTTLALGVGLGALCALSPARARPWALYALSVLAVYLLQPPLNIRFADFLLPTATLLLAVAGWVFTRPSDPGATRGLSRDDLAALGVGLALIFALSLNRFIEAGARLTPSRPPDPVALLAGLAVFGAALLAADRALHGRWRQRIPLIGVIALFVILKFEPLGAALSGAWRAATIQDVTLATGAELNWLGFSYLAFRLIHTLRDRQSGLLPALSLREYLTYALFFPALIAGPIDRAERFAGDLRALPGLRGFDAARWAEGLGRIALGVGKKFVIADTLALGMALTPQNAAQIESTPALWALLYGYALRLYFDFAGYSDIAIGLGMLFGVRLPENFSAPYTKTSITAFWQSWHMTLSAWARAYIFSPLSRALLTDGRLTSTQVVLVAHLTTMLVIGLWHGITVSFALWGAWHGLALFIHKLWSDRTRRWYRGLSAHPMRKRAWTFFAWLLTLHTVVIGWVWFALPDPASALRVLGGLFGMWR